jgi:hypothetical protein
VVYKASCNGRRAVTFERPQVVCLCSIISAPCHLCRTYMALRETLYSPNPASPALSVVFDDMDGAETASIAPSDAPSQQDRDAQNATIVDLLRFDDSRQSV